MGYPNLPETHRERGMEMGRVMREIKFRGKRIDNGEWVFGYYKYTKMLHEHIIVGDDDYVSYTVIPETVGQYTGLRDRNGVETYEGDILRDVDSPLTDKLPFKVIWSVVFVGLEGGVRTYPFYQSIASDCEVIGNIHDNLNEVWPDIRL